MGLIELPKDAVDQLICDAKNGSSYALGQLLQLNYSAVYKFMLKLTLDAEAARDVTQDCMVRVIEKFPLFDPGKASLTTWMISIAKNLWIEDCRRKIRSHKYLGVIGEKMQSDTEFQKDEIQLKEELISAIRRLHEKERIPVILKHLGGYSYEEIARMLKIPLGTVKSRISVGMKSLKKEMDGYERE